MQVQSIPFSEYHAWAEIIIPLALPKNFTWAIPAALEPKLKIGMRVEVTLGKNKRYAGIVKHILYEAPAYETKPIIQILDEQPVVFAKQLALWEWMAGYYLCTEGDVMQAAVPSNLKLNSETVLSWNEAHDDDISDLDDNEYLVAEALQMKRELRLSEIQQILDGKQVHAIIKKLLQKQICFVWEELKPKYKERQETFVLLHPDYANEAALEQLLNQPTRATKQMELLLAFLHFSKLQQGEVKQVELLQKANASAAQLKGLIDKKILYTERRSVHRLPQLPPMSNVDFALSDAQTKALESLQNSLQTQPIVLLHGVTASGKTQLYIHLIAKYLQAGKQVLYMLPEIALTAQTIRRLQQHFGGNIAVYHSKFNPNERVELWHKVREGNIRIVLGARSAMLLPFQDLGLIIIDEEHDASYKQQDPAPRYHARDTAIYYASLHQAKVVLGSATPSIESYYNALTGKYGLVTLSERYADVALPAIEMVDTRMLAKEHKAKVLLSPALHEAITQTLAAHKQVIIFQNRRGYTPYQVCGVCGWVPQCRHCSVSLTYHKSTNKLSCHYCGTHYPVVQTCQACGSSAFVEKNFGTERVEEAFAEAFPHAKVARMDYDSVKGKYDHDNLIQQFEQQKLDILVGTQMLVKGLDFAHVQLVGVLDADGLLHFSDFRVNERAYQLLEQVSGRAGRKDGLGKVMIQVSDVQHPVLQFVRNHDFKALYDFELPNRQLFQYPPFSRVIKLTFRHKQSHIAEDAAHWVMKGLAANYGTFIQGPAQPVINRIRNEYLWEVLIKLPRNTKLIAQCKQAIRQQIQILQSDKTYRSVHVIPDVDVI